MVCGRIKGGLGRFRTHGAITTSGTSASGMAMEVFNELSESLREAIEIKNGKRKPARFTTYSPIVLLRSVNNSA